MNQDVHIINRILKQQHDSIIKEWTKDVLFSWTSTYPNVSIKEGELYQQAIMILNEIEAVFLEHQKGESLTIKSASKLAMIAVELSKSRAKLGFKPADTAQYVVALKSVLTKRLLDELEVSPNESLSNGLLALNELLDAFSLLTFEAYVEARDQIIALQSQSLLELSTPVVRLWDQIILLPLIGIIDTIRARQLTESMLESITRYEAVVTILDVTGVPVFDTAIARHLIKAIDAAQLLGTRVIMTGISIEGAQTLTSLNISFSNVISRATLRSGIAEALHLVDRRIVPIENTVSPK